MATVLTKDGRQSSAEDLQEKSDVKHLEDDKKVAGAMNVEAEIHWRTIAAVFFSAFIAFAQLVYFLPFCQGYKANTFSLGS